MSDQLEKHIELLYEPVQKIASGAYGHVWEVIEKSTGKTYAMKKSFDAFHIDIDAQRTFR